MNVLGISGLDRSVAFKKRRFPNLEPGLYRIAQGFDAAAALCTGGGIRSAVSEERFSREKATNAFPVHAIRYCLDAAGLSPEDLDVVAHSFSYEPWHDVYSLNDALREQYDVVYAPEAQLRCLGEHFPKIDWSEKFVSVRHHDAHAASAYFPSGFDEALIVVWDGMGEEDATTIAIGQGPAIRVVQRISVPHSLGLLYGLCTLHLGFAFGLDEYKVMGLAPYGRSERFFDSLMTLIELRSDGTYGIPALGRGDTYVSRETYSEVLALLAERLGPPRLSGQPITSAHCDAAAAVQAVLERTCLHVLRCFQTSTGLKNLCLAGGVALNCKVNGEIKRSRLFRRVFVQPAAGDDGTALGAALYAQRHRLPTQAYGPMTLPFWGPAYRFDDIGTALAAAPGCSTVAFGAFDDLAHEVATRLADGAIVGWFQGRMEFGPRALGNRSILADPRRADSRDRLNRLVKKREDFRPFAPAVPEEHAATYFEIDKGDERTYAHMLFVADVRPSARGLLPAVTHVDGSARVQVVCRRDHPRFWTVLQEFGRITGVPVLLNTSFNGAWEPIVCSPEEAIRTFFAAGLDALAIGQVVLVRGRE